MNYLQWALSLVETHNGAVTAVATVFIAVFTIVLAFVTARQARLTKEAVNLGRQEFIASHRPRLVIRRIDVGEIGDGKFNMQCTLANEGDSDGRVVDSRYGFEFSEGRKFGPFGDGNFGTHDLPPGTEVRIMFNVGINDGAALHLAMAEDLNPPRQLYFRGFVLYADKNEVMRRAYFSRRYDPSAARFWVTNDPDYDD